MYLDGNVTTLGTVHCSSNWFLQLGRLCSGLVCLGGTEMYAHNSEWIALGIDNGDAQGIKIGYNGWNDLVPDIQDSTISGVATIVTTMDTRALVVGKLCLGS